MMSPPAARIHSPEKNTAFVRYQEAAALEPKIIGPMPLRMAEGWVQFLNGFPWPHTGGVDRTDPRRALPEYD